jgi:hypothetical protein
LRWLGYEAARGGIRAPLFLLALAATVMASTEVRSESLAYTLQIAPGDELLGWSFGHGEVPAVAQEGTFHVRFGQPALDEHTLLLLGFDEGRGSTLRDGSEVARRIALPGEGWRFSEGRFGRALEAGDAAPPLRLADLELPEAWTLELWIRVDRTQAQAELLSLGPLTIELGEGRRVRASLGEGVDPARIGSGESVPEGRFVHVGLACDGGAFRHLRLSVDGVARSRALPEAATCSLSGRLRLGGSEAGPRRRYDALHVVGRALPTATLLERAHPLPEPGEHRLRLRLRSGVQEKRLFTPLVSDALLRGAALARGDLRNATADAGGLRFVPGHWRRVHTGIEPTARTTHPTVHVGDHRVFLFGGEVRDTHFPPMLNTSDTWLYDAKRERWEEVVSAQAPSPRCHQAAAYSPDHDRLLYVGGWHNSAVEKFLLSDTWLFDPREGQWEQRHPSGDALPTLSDSGIVYHARARRFLLFRQSQIYAYDPDADHWSKLPPAEVFDERGRPDRLAGRVSPIAGYDPESGLVLLFGGAVVSRGERIYTDTTALYDYEHNRWTVLRPTLAPPPRVRGALAYDGRRQRFLMFGGVRDQYSKRYGDLFAFDVGSRRWSRVKASNAPSPRGGYYGMAYDPELDLFVLAAGRATGSEFLDETWHLRFREEGHATYVFDRSHFPGQGRFLAVGHDASGAGVSFRFAGSADGSEWSDSSDSPRIDAGWRYVKVEVRLHRHAGVSPRLMALGFTARDDEGVSGDGVILVDAAIPPLGGP